MTSPSVVGRHFHVPADELLLDDPVRCDFLPALALDGVAVTPQGQHHLVLSLAGIARFYVGPDDITVTRRAQILTAALNQHLDADHATVVGDWIRWAWEELLDELVAQLTRALN